MRVIALSFAALFLLAGCSASASAPTEVTPPVPETAPSKSASLEPERPVLLPATETKSGWIWRGADPGFGKSFYHQPITVDTAQGKCTFKFEKDAGETELTCTEKGGSKVIWIRNESGAFMEDAVLLADPEHLYVARYSNISDGATVLSYRLTTGELEWQTRVIGLGPIGHSEYLNKVEMRLVGGVLSVFGWESAGRYRESIDAVTGRITLNRRYGAGGEPTDLVPPPLPEDAEPAHPGAAASESFAFTTQPKLPTGTVQLLTPGGPACLFVVADPTGPACAGPASKISWASLLANQFVPAAAMVADQDKLYVVNYCAISSGAKLTAYGLKTGKVLWQRQLHALGPIDHSKYSNVVDLRFSGTNLVVSGWEAAGKYVEVVDSNSGKDLGNRKVP